MTVSSITNAFRTADQYDYIWHKPRDDVVREFFTFIGLDIPVDEILSVIPRELPESRRDFIKLMQMAAIAVR